MRQASPPLPRPDRSEHPTAASHSLRLGTIVVSAVLGVVLGTTAAGLWQRAHVPTDTSVEAGFARDMATHHRQAVEMSFLILERSDDPLIKGLAADIIVTQEHQIGQMLAWLDLWGLPAADAEPPMAWMGHPAGDRMPGMATPEELARLASMSGIEADREFLRLMIRHHQGGLPMAQAALDRSGNDLVQSMARSTIESQLAEVRTMERLLAQKAGASAATPADPADHEHDSD